MNIKKLAHEEIYNSIQSWDLSPKSLYSFREEVMDAAKAHYFVKLVEEIFLNESHAYDYFYIGLSEKDTDNLYYCDELDQAIIDCIDELLD